MNRSSGLLRWVLALCVLGILSGTVSGRGVWDADEPRVAAISLEMADDLNFVVPHLAGEPFVEKPPLYFGVAALLVRAVSRWTGYVGAVRLTSTLFALATLFFAHRLGLLLGGASVADWTVMVLATMYGFLVQSTWIRVDVALLMCVTAANWSFAGAYLTGRLRLLPLGGAFLGLALLAKGLIGPALIFPCWLATVLPWAWDPAQWRREGVARIARLHLLALVAAVGVAGFWMLSFYDMAGPDLWKRWLMDNQFGRVTGAAGLGHVSAETEPLFYAKAAVGYSAPWLPLVLLWGVRRVLERRLSRENLLLLAWVVGGLVLLTLSSTKRNLYILPLLPAFALMCANVAEDLPGWAKTLCRVVMAGAALVPLALLMGPAVNSVFPEVGYVEPALLPGFEPVHVVALLGLAINLFLVFRARPMDPVARTAAALVVAWIACGAVCLPALDRTKNLSGPTRAFLLQLPPKSTALAAFGMGEKEKGLLYLYGRRSVQTLSCARVNRILRRSEPDLEGVLVGQMPAWRDCVRVPYRIRATAVLGDRTGPDSVYWLVPASDGAVGSPDESRF